MARDGLLIGEVAAKSGVSRKALRLYEKAGILPAPRRTGSGYRMYGPETLALLGFVTKARRLGFGLEEIGPKPVHEELQSPEEPRALHVEAELPRRRVGEVAPVVRDEKAALMFEHELGQVCRNVPREGRVARAGILGLGTRHAAWLLETASAEYTDS